MAAVVRELGCGDGFAGEGLLDQVEERPSP
jgi:hypothetical protein